MPSIEIICVGQDAPIDFDLPFAVLAENRVVSHRDPSRFHEDFEQLDGVIYHLGNPDLKADFDDRRFFAYDLIRDEADAVAGALQFQEDQRAGVRLLTEQLLAASPIGWILFTSDWQFGPDTTTRIGEVSLTEFWALHDAGQLRLNASYRITSPSPA